MNLQHLITLIQSFDNQCKSFLFRSSQHFAKSLIFLLDFFFVNPTLLRPTKKGKKRSTKTKQVDESVEKENDVVEDSQNVEDVEMKPAENEETDIDVEKPTKNQ